MESIEHEYYPDLLKIDIDGAEMSALRGMSRILQETEPDLLLEVHPTILPRAGSSAAEVWIFCVGLTTSFFNPQFSIHKDATPYANLRL